MKTFLFFVFCMVISYFVGACQASLKIGVATTRGLRNGTIQLHDPHCPNGGMIDPSDNRCKSSTEVFAAPSATHAESHHSLL